MKNFQIVRLVSIRGCPGSLPCARKRRVRRSFKCLWILFLFTGEFYFVAIRPISMYVRDARLDVLRQLDAHGVALDEDMEKRHIPPVR